MGYGAGFIYHCPTEIHKCQILPACYANTGSIPLDAGGAGKICSVETECVVACENQRRISMSRRLLRGFVAVFLGSWIALTACGDDNGTGPGDGGSGSSITFPLEIGNVWIYEAETETLKVAQSQMDTSRVVGTEEYEGETYYVVEGGTEGETEQILIRQQGQDIFVVPYLEKKRKDDPFEDWFNRVMEQSFPWKYADLDASSGSTWIIAEAETTMLIGLDVETIEIEIAGSSLGRESISVPAGDYDDVYVGGLTISLAIGEDTMEPSSQRFWIADDIGLVKDENTETYDIGFGEPATVTNTPELTSYTLE
jgi:hypothetical protein